jgi:tetratricopeptide (TPR) repeat protein
MTVTELARQLETSRRRLDQLALGDLDVRTSIEVSLATATERGTVEAFTLLGLYDGEVLDVRVAARLLELPVAEAERCLEQLVDLHLLDSPAPRRYRMHDLVRSYVRETTAARTDDAARAAARLRVLRFYLAMCWRLRTLRYLGKLTSDWYDVSWTEDADELTADEILDWLDDEAEEILAAVGRAASGSAAERATVARIAVGLNPHLVRRRRYSDGVALGRAALAAEAGAGDPFAAVMVPFELSQHYAQLGLRDLAVDQLKAALAAPRSADYDLIRLNGLIFVAEHLYGLGRHDEAAATADRAKTMALELGNEAGEAEAQRILGMVAGRQGKPEDQDDRFERALAVIRRIGDAGEKHWMLYTIGISYRESGRLEKALAAFEECRVIAMGGDDQFAVAEAHEELGRTELERGEPAAAEQHLRAALEPVRGTWLPEARVRRYLGVALRALGRLQEASAEWRRSLELLTRHGAPEAPELRALLDQV